MQQRKEEESPGLALYEEVLRRELRVLIAEKNLAQKTVAHALGKVGVRETAKGLSAKLNAGTFSAAYYLAIKDVIKAL